MPKNTADNVLALISEPNHWDISVQQLALPFFIAIRNAITSQPRMPEDEFRRLLHFTFIFLTGKIDQHVERLKFVVYTSPSRNDETNKEIFKKGSEDYVNVYNKVLESFNTLSDALRKKIVSLNCLYNSFEEDEKADPRQNERNEITDYIIALRSYFDSADALIVIMKKISGTQVEPFQGMITVPEQVLGQNLRDFYCAPMTFCGDEFYEKGIIKEDLADAYGWKMHMSFAYEDLNKAYEICLPILNAQVETFKIASPVWLAQASSRPELRHGGQVTIYLETKGNAFQDKEKLKVVMKILNKALQENNIRPGKYPATLPLKDSIYFSIRNDISPSGQYIPTGDCMGCYNPAGTIFPADLVELLPDDKKAQYSAYGHFNLFVPQDEDELWIALVHTLNAFLKGNHSSSNKELFSHNHTNTEASERDLKIANEIINLYHNQGSTNPYYKFQFCVDEPGDLKSLLCNYDRKMRGFLGDAVCNQMKRFEYKPADKNKLRQ